MATSQLRCWHVPCSAGSSNALTLRLNSFPIGSRIFLGSVARVSLGTKASASLTTRAIVTSTYTAQRFVVPVLSCTPLLIGRICSGVQTLPPVLRLYVASVGLWVFALLGLVPFVRLFWTLITKKDDNWETSQTRTVLTTYIRPIVLWTGIIMMCRALDSVELASEASTVIKLRFIHFMRSLATVTVFALCAGSLIQHVQKYLMKRTSLKDSRSMSLTFVGNAVSTSVWVAAVCLFLELLGFSTHKWLAAGGVGTVLLTLAGREIFTNFLSSMMIHVTKPFVESEWIQTKIEGQEVVGTVERVGWWSPTVIRGSEREAVLVPNHKFSVSVVRNFTQKTHWRIKTHIGINHRDVQKISNIVADMRKVLANHPEIEQKRLHRRVFFDHINSQNLALMIIVSCFVKTSRFEEYLRVKEVILLDLLKVVAHHGGRLATPLRSMQRTVDDSESRPVSSDGSQARPILLNTVLTKSGDADQKVTSNNPMFDQKSYVRKQSFKESAQTVEAQAVVSVASDTKDQSDPLSKWKARKSISRHVSFNKGVPATSTLQNPPAKSPDDEPG
ncbi:mechanosensitive ion channel protein 2, chloroplastic isoform X2 [Physcomitrium patens]|uniref:MscS-Like mechanosensitive ion channel n=1 Tax=Physcomitrium patens TaxID=3218 RepID=A0A7I4D7W4_PHYPA|nr:mechanosensitive ion channel protein 2, chloroplastic-like isoform X2 [Physcomitrium patens]|eukprot:XP_024360334.1 mechanosensitive ion channel protein 2, chloroplastic-like isoform X2 [Physcomitrella patens]